MLVIRMLTLATRILLAVVLTITSPAWCACAFAAMAADGQGAASGCTDDCCPPADDCVPCDQATADRDQHPDADHDDGGGLPCRDQSDCSCCDAGSLTPSCVSKEIGVPKSLTRSDFAPLPAPFQAMLTAALVAPDGDDPPPLAFAARSAPPLTAATPLLLRGCLLLT
jgi:hypothetical protein